MGYAHYWDRRNETVTTEQWNSFTDDVRKIFKKHADILCRESSMKDRVPVVDDTEVRFNGKEGYETCLIQRDFHQVEWRSETDLSFNFCKTAHKPYDAVVVAVLSCLRHYMGDVFIIDSDGDDKTFPAYEDLVSIYEFEPKQIAV